jgi:hypothetical protein
MSIADGSKDYAPDCPSYPEVVAPDFMIPTNNIWCRSCNQIEGDNMPPHRIDRSDNRTIEKYRSIT